MNSISEFLLDHAEFLITTTTAIVIRWVERKRMKKRFSMNGNIKI